MVECMSLCDDRLPYQVRCWLFGWCRLWQVRVSALLAQKLQVVHLQAAESLFQFRPSLVGQMALRELAQGLQFVQAAVAV